MRLKGHRMKGRANFYLTVLLLTLMAVPGYLPAALFMKGGDAPFEGIGIDGALREEIDPKLQEIIDEYKRGELDGAAKRASALAIDGSAGAQFLLGFMFEQGKGVARDPAQAARWYEKSAEQGVLAAKLNLGLLHFRKVHSGEEGGDIKAAIKWFQSADREADAKSAFYLGEIHRRGLGGKKDEAKAFNYYRKAAERDLPMGCNRAGVALAEGMGTEKDPGKAFEYFMKAAKGGLVDGMYNVALSYQGGLGVENDNIQAAAWFLQAARGGYVPAFIEVGRRYVDGDGIMKDETAGAAWLHRASVAGKPRAQFLLAQLYLNGVGVERNPRSALNLFANASNSGDMDARLALARMLASGLGTEDGKPKPGDAHGLAVSAGETLKEARDLSAKLEEVLTGDDKKTSRELLEKLKESDKKRSEPAGGKAKAG